MTIALHAWFARPALLGALALVPLLALLTFFAHRARQRALARLASPLSARKLTGVRRRWRTGLALVGLLALAVACAGPQWGQDPHQWRAPVANLAIVLDLSRTMSAEQPSRRERALRALRDVADHLEAQGGCRIALVAFAGRPRLLFPLTRDYDHFRHALAQIEADDIPSLSPGPDESLVSGTRIGAALTLAVRALDAERAGPRALVLLSDGDDPAADQEWRAGVQAAQAEQVPIHVVGVGDPQAEHTIPERDGVVRYAGTAVQTRLDEEVLREIARRTGGTYLPARTDTIPLGTLVQALLAQPAAEGALAEAGRPVPAQRYAWFLVPALVLLVLTMLLPDGSRRRPRLPQAALAGLCVVLLSAAPTAQEVQEFVRQGNEAFARQQFEEALAHYAQAEEKCDDPGLVAFNEAAAYYRLGRHRDAELHYRRCLDDDRAPSLRRARASFDLGNTLVRQAGAHDAALLAQAVGAYRACLAAAVTDADLRTDARHNLELAQILWLKARAHTPERPQDQSPQAPPQSEKNQRKPGEKEAKSPEPKEDGKAGTESKGQAPGARPHDTKKIAAGLLQVLPDDDRLVPLAPGETEAHLRRLAERISRERRHHNQARPSHRLSQGLVDPMLRCWLPFVVSFAFVNPLRIDAQPTSAEPPIAGRPLQFSGVVGQYALEATAAPTTVHVEEPITLRVRLSGRGPAAYQPQREHLRLFPADFEQDFYVEGVPAEDRLSRADGAWEFVYRLRPKHENLEALSGLKLVYYNPARKRYETAYPDADIPLVVRARPQAHDNWEVASTPVPASFYALAAVDPSPTPIAAPALATHWLILFALAVPLACWLGARLSRRLLSGGHTAGASAPAQRALKELEAGAEPPWLVVNRYLRDRLGYSAAEPTPAEAARFLKRRGLARTACAQSRAFYAACDAARFAPADSAEAGLLRAEASCLIQAVEADKCLA